MREFFSFCFDQLTDPLSLSFNPVLEYIILTLLGLLALKLAYGLVGDMYGSDIISGSIVGSIFHWFLRTIIFVTLWRIANALIAVCRFIAEHWVLLLAILGGALCLVVAFF